MKIMLAQIAPRVGDITGNIEMIMDAASRAENASCDLIVFPELAVTGYPPYDLMLRPSFMEAVDFAVD